MNINFISENDITNCFSFNLMQEIDITISINLTIVDILLIKIVNNLELFK